MVRFGERQKAGSSHRLLKVEQLESRDLLSATAVSVPQTTLDEPALGIREREVTVRWGPYEVPAATEHGPAHFEKLDLFVDVPAELKNSFITGITPNLVDEEGNTINFSTGGMLHHAVLFNQFRADATNSGTLDGLLGERFFATGNEMSGAELPDGYGYYNGPLSPWHVAVELMNFTEAPKEMYLEFTFTYELASRRWRMNPEPVKPVWLDLDNGGDSQVSVPAGYSDTQADWVSTLSGDIVAIGGHLHDYGISVSTEQIDPDTGASRYLFTSTAGYAAGSPWAPVGPGAGTDAGHPAAHNVLSSSNPAYQAHIEEMTFDTDASFMHIDRGDILRLHTQYHVPEARDDVMGIMIAYVDVGGDRGERLSSAGPDDDSLSELWDRGWNFIRSEVLPRVPSTVEDILSNIGNSPLAGAVEDFINRLRGEDTPDHAPPSHVAQAAEFSWRDFAMGLFDRQASSQQPTERPRLSQAAIDLLMGSGLR